MKGLVIKSEGRDFIALLPLEYGWWIATCFTKRGQKLFFVLEDNWSDLWPKRGIPIEIPEETS